MGDNMWLNKGKTCFQKIYIYKIGLMMLLVDLYVDIILLFYVVHPLLGDHKVIYSLINETFIKRVN